MDVEEEVVRQLAEQVVTVIAGVEPAFASPGRWTDRADYVTGVVHISGGWSGDVVVMCSHTAAQRIAGRIFETAPEAASDDDVCEVLKELANVVGGNIKPLLPGPSLVSLPASDATRRSVSPPEGVEAWVDCDGEPFLTRIVTTTDNTAQTTRRRENVQ